MKVSASEFQQHVGRYQQAAQAGPVAITRNGRDHTVLLSAAYFELLTHGRTARKIEDLDAATLKAIAESEVPPEYAHLDRLLDGSSL